MATIAIIHETRRTLSDGTHPVKLRVTHKGVRKYYTLKVTDRDEKKILKNDRITTIGLSVEAWERVQGKNPRKQYRDIKLALNAHETIAIGIIDGLKKKFTFAEFEKQFDDQPDEKEVEKERVKNDLLQMLKDRHEELVRKEKLRTADVYKYAMKSIHGYVKKDRLDASEITIEWLNNYEKWMKESEREKSPTTISMYIRAVRAVLIRSGKDVSTVFGINRYEIPESRNIKKAISKKHIGLIYNYDAAPNSMRERYRDYWILSYLCGGANITDLAQLKYKNIDGESIIFIRQKRAHRMQDFTIIAMTQEVARLIDKYKQPYKSEETYILPILKDNMTAKQRLTAIRNTVRGINKHIKVIAANIGISTNITTYTARHTHATVKRDAGYSALQIAEDMGTSEKVVKRNYISNTDMDKKHQMAAILTNWDDG